MIDDKTNIDLDSLQDEVNNISSRITGMAHDLHWGLFGIWILLALILWRVW